MANMSEANNGKVEKILKMVEVENLPSEITYHPSECVNSNSESKINSENDDDDFDVINDYHIYCKWCQHHLYSSSKLNDINSFFQIHINSINHVWNRKNFKWNGSNQILKWDKWLLTGSCEICNESEIEAFIIDTNIDLLKIKKEHLNTLGHIRNYYYLGCKPFNYLMAKSNVFCNIYICQYSESCYICYICDLKINDEALLYDHLNSEDHVLKFSFLLNLEFNVLLESRPIPLDCKTLENGLQELVKQKKDLDFEKNFKLLSKDEVCPSDGSQIQCLSDANRGFSPLAVEKFYSIKDEDLIRSKYCGLCQKNENDMSGHLSTNSHLLRVMIYNRCNSVRRISPYEYLSSCHSPTSKRPDLEKYTKYERALQKLGLNFGIPFKPEYLDIDLIFDEESTMLNREDSSAGSSTNDSHAPVVNKFENQSTDIRMTTDTVRYGDSYETLLVDSLIVFVEKDKVKLKQDAPKKKKPAKVRQFAPQIEEVTPEKEKKNIKNSKLINVVENVLRNDENVMKQESAKFLCYICMVKDDINQIQNHLKSKGHIINEKYIADEFHVTAKICIICGFLLAGTLYMISEHFASRYHKKKDTAAVGQTQNISHDMFHLTKYVKVKGIKSIPFKLKSRKISSILQKYGQINCIKIKDATCMLVNFVDPQVAEEVAALQKLKVTNSLVLEFSILYSGAKINGLSTEVIALFTNREFFEQYIFGLSVISEKFLSGSERRREDLLCSDLKEIFRIITPNFKIIKFGSRVTTLCMDECDLDLFIEMENTYCRSDKEDREEVRDMVSNLAQLLRKSSKFYEVRCVKNARVPIVSGTHKKTRLKCDISFTNGIGCENTKLVKFMIGLDARVKEMILFMKYWLRVNKIYGSPHFTSHSFTMLVIYYLQQLPNPVLPTVQYLKSCYDGPAKLIGQWECGFTTNKKDVPKSKNSDSVGQLIFGFFQFVENFDFPGKVILPLIGKALPRKLFTDAGKNGLPMPLYEYSSHIPSIKFSGGTLIKIMDVFDFSRNITEGLSAMTVTKFHYACRITKNMLSYSYGPKADLGISFSRNKKKHLPANK